MCHLHTKTATTVQVPLCIVTIVAIHPINHLWGQTAENIRGKKQFAHLVQCYRCIRRSNCFETPVLSPGTRSVAGFTPIPRLLLSCTMPGWFSGVRQQTIPNVTKIGRQLVSCGCAPPWNILANWLRTILTAGTQSSAHVRFPYTFH